MYTGFINPGVTFEVYFNKVKKYEITGVYNAGLNRITADFTAEQIKEMPLIADVRVRFGADKYPLRVKIKPSSEGSSDGVVGYTIGLSGDSYTVVEILGLSLVEEQVTIATEKAAEATTQASISAAGAATATDKATEASGSATAAANAKVAAESAQQSAQADSAQTALDRVATSQDRGQTGLDKDATAADRVQTGLDKTATAADRVQTGLDVISTLNNKNAAAISETNAANSATAASINSNVYLTEAAGRAAVADGQTFLVAGSGDVSSYRYRRTNSTTSVLEATNPSNQRFPTKYVTQSITAVDGEYYSRTTGLPVASANYSRYALAHTSGDDWRISGATNGSVQSLIVYLAANGSILGTQENGVNGTTNTFVEQPLVVPANTVTIAISSYLSAQIVVRKKQSSIVVGETEKAVIDSNVSTNQSDIALISSSIPREWKLQTLSITTGSFYNRFSGKIVVNASYSCSEFAYRAGDQLLITGATSATTTALAIFLNADNAVIGLLNAGTGSTVIYTDVAASPPAGTVKIRITTVGSNPLRVKKSVLTQLPSAAQLESRAKVTEGYLPTQYANFAVTVTPNFYWSKTTLQPVANAAWKITELTFVEGESYSVSCSVNGAATAMAIFLNEFNISIGTQHDGVNGVTTVYTDEVLTPPAGTTRILLTGYYTGLLVVKKRQLINAGSKAILDDVSSRLSTTESNMPFEYVAQTMTIIPDSYYSKFSGSLVANTAYDATSIDNYDGVTTYAVSCDVNGGSTSLAVYLDASNAIIGTQGDGANGVTVTYNNQALTPPAGTKKILLTAFYTGLFIVSKKTAVRAMGINEASGALSPWNGKKIVWFGTSIPATGYPQILGNLTGANIVNEAVGSSMVRRGKIGTTAEDPYGWSGLAWQNVGRSLSQTLAEKNDLINNWSTWRTILTNTPPTTLSAGDIAQILDCSWENKLNRHLGTGNRADLYIIDHGHNDNLTSDSDSQYTSVPADSNDRNTFIGSVNYIVRKILEDNPRARIAFVGHYENARKTRISTAQQTLAEYWDFPLLELWKKMGWTQQQVTTSGFWSSGTWNASGGTPTLRTITQIWMEDDLHPTSDPAKQIIAKNILPWLNSIA